MATEQRLLFISNLFPARESAYNGLDNAVLLHHLKPTFDIRVICPKAVLPPWKKPLFTAREEDSSLHPIYVPVPYLPKIGDRWNDHLMRKSLRPVFEKLIGEWRPDSILCSWLYPDACAVAVLARQHGIPCDLITQGSDTHQYLNYPIRHRRILEAIQNSRQVICRSGDLARRLAAAGVNEQQLHTVYNGINPEVFHYHNESVELRQKLKLAEEAPLLLFVGNFLPVKNPLFLLQALATLRSTSHPKARLVMIGDGPMREAIKQKARDLGIQDALILTGACSSAQVADYLNASDLFCLSSHNEGLPNVILEALACGLPVVSTDVGGIAELINNSDYGSLVPANEASSLSHYIRAIQKNLEHSPNRELIADYGKQFSWQKSADCYRKLILSQEKHPDRPRHTT